MKTSLANPVKTTAQHIAPARRPETATTKNGRIKVRLFYLTEIPTHERSFMLKEDFQAEPPFIEDVCVLMHCNRVRQELDCFRPAFEQLQLSGVLPRRAILKEFRLLDEDTQTLAYLI